ncbi:MAG: LPS-assembly protein LptD, partial [Bacteroidales bacterium]|nr:LPS-assembly protein LptD [Bacteroidales bacterium]
MTGLSVLSQNDRRTRRANRNKEAAAINLDTIPADMPDTSAEAIAKLVRRDSINKAKKDSTDLLQKSSLESPAFTSGSDSVIEVFTNGARKIYYYGDVKVEYGNMTLTADYMEYDMNTSEVFARGTYDSLAGEWIGRPSLQQDNETYEMDEVRYNFNSQKARITNMVTQQQEGILKGKNIKMMPDKSINITKGIYTVCDAEEPHYHINLSAAKVLTKPQQVTVFGPATVEFEGVKLPIGIPFGFIPKKPQRATGMLTPTFGEENSRGFYLRDGGMYFVFGEYLDLSVTGDIYSLGSWALDVNSRYRVNYKFNGNFGLTYSNDQTGEKGSADFFQSRNFALKWSHSQDSKAHPGSSFSAS